MPEGPEVKIVTESLSQYISGRTVVAIEILSGRYQRHGPPEGLDVLQKELPATFDSVSCKGKFIYAQLGGWFMWNTLGMTGGWSQSPKKHSRVKFTFQDGSCVHFNDPRNFGTLKFCSDIKGLQQKLKSLGPDMLAEDVSDEAFSAAISSRRGTIAEAVMDQSVISGVGNYLKSESLYFSGISPHRICSTLSPQELSRLNATIKSVIRASYQTGGATIYTFQNFEGEKGEYTRRFAVYNQVKDPQGLEVTREVTNDGRTTFWVKGVQT